MSRLNVMHTSSGFSPGILLVSILLLTTVGRLAAQPTDRMISPPDVEVRTSSGDILPNPFSGGLDLTRIGLWDDDRDGYPDLWTFNLGGEFRRYDNRGGLLYVREDDRRLDDLPIRSWFRFADIDRDELADLFTSGARSEVMILRNVGSPGLPVFAPADTLRQADRSVIYTEQLTVPTFVDIDDDGDLDLFAGNVDGTITFYENVGSAGDPSFTFRTNRYEGLVVLSPAGTRKGEEVPTVQHGASVLDFVDLDGDEDEDILFGDFFTTGLLYFENRGTPRQADFDTLWVDTAFAPFGDQVRSTGFNQAESGDVDRDGDIDVFVSSLLASARTSPIELYENRGTPSTPLLIRALSNPTGEIDVGRRAAPAWIEDQERRGLLVGSEEGTLTWYPVEIEGNTIRITERRRYRLEGLTSAIPTAGDLDGDGRAEIVVGKSDALDGTTMRLYRFDGDDIVRIPWQLDTTFNVVRSGAAPRLVDIDGDRDLDIFVGGRNGRFALFLNVGTRTAPLFEVRTPPVPFDTLDLGANAAPGFVDLDGDGDPDAIVGARDNTTTGDLDSIRIWINEGGIFREDPAWPPRRVSQYPVPLWLDIAGRTILLIGTGPGGLLWYGDPAASSVRADQVDAGGIVVRSGADRRSIVVERGGEGDRLELFDPTGRLLFAFTLERGAARIDLDDSRLPEGVILWQIGEESGVVR